MPGSGSEPVDDICRNTRNSMISIHELNEQLQNAATKYEREKSLREKAQVRFVPMKADKFLHSPPSNPPACDLCFDVKDEQHEAGILPRCVCMFKSLLCAVHSCLIDCFAKQAELKVLQEDFIHCKRQNQVLQTKAAQKSQVELLQNEAIKYARHQCSNHAQLQFSHQMPFSDDAPMCNKSSLNKRKPINKVHI